MELRWGVVGLGRLADQSIAPAIRVSKTGTLVSCAGRTYERTKEFAATHGVAKAHPSYQDLVRDPDVDAVFVATPNNLHYPVVLAAAAAGKQVLCEKPMAMTAREAEEMVAACRKAGVVLRVALQMRFMPVLRAAAAMVREGRVGEVREVSLQRYAPMTQPGQWRKDLSQAGAGVLADTGVHLIDFVQWIVGDRIARVFGLAHPPRSSGRPDDTAALLMEFDGGCQASVRMSREMPVADNSLQIFGTGGMLRTGPLRWVDVHHLTLRRADGSSEEHEYPAGNQYLDEIDAFAREVEGANTGMATGEDGLRLARVMDAVIRSLELGIAVPAEG